MAFSCDTLISQGLVLQLFFNMRLCIVREYKSALEAVAVIGKSGLWAAEEVRPGC